MRRFSWLAVIAIAEWIAGGPAIGQAKKQAPAPQEPTSGKTDETTYRQRGTKDAPLFIHIEQDPQGKSDAADTKKETPSKDFYDKLTAWGAAVAALFTFALAIIGFWGVWVARSGVQVARDTLTAIQGQLTEIQNAGAQTVTMLEHASTQAKAASDSVHISELAMITTVRAYVHRVTKFCAYIRTVTGNPRHPYAERINPVGIAFATYESHNCCDEECG